jgi:hypothetical protein
MKIKNGVGVTTVPIRMSHRYQNLAEPPSSKYDPIVNSKLGCESVSLSLWLCVIILIM